MMTKKYINHHKISIHLRVLERTLEDFLTAGLFAYFVDLGFTSGNSTSSKSS
jgi:hypothetical protein